MNKGKKRYLSLFAGMILAVIIIFFIAKPSDTRDEFDVVAPEMAAMHEMEKNLLENSKVLKQGTFNEVDFYHKAKGTATVVSTIDGAYLKLEDFKTSIGPDLYVYISKNKDITNTKDLGEFTTVGRLISREGDQMYKMPDDALEYQSVLIWCKAFSVLFSEAELN